MLTNIRQVYKYMLYSQSCSNILHSFCIYISYKQNTYIKKNLFNIYNNIYTENGLAITSIQLISTNPEHVILNTQKTLQCNIYIDPTCNQRYAKQNISSDQQQKYAHAKILYA